jgi:hypothetical protein
VSVCVGTWVCCVEDAANPGPTHFLKTSWFSAFRSYERLYQGPEGKRPKAARLSELMTDSRSCGQCWL